MRVGEFDTMTSDEMIIHLFGRMTISYWVENESIVGGLDSCERWILNLKPKELGQNWMSKSTIRKYNYLKINLVGRAGVWSIWAPFATRRLHSKEETN